MTAPWEEESISWRPLLRFFDRRTLMPPTDDAFFMVVMIIAVLNNARTGIPYAPRGSAGARIVRVHTEGAVVPMWGTAMVTSLVVLMPVPMPVLMQLRQLKTLYWYLNCAGLFSKSIGQDCDATKFF
ncbi:MAG: hypothetical protein AB7G75_37555 [Candidatus Binatia bacterium]